MLPSFTKAFFVLFLSLSILPGYAADKEIIAVMDFEGVGIKKDNLIALSNRMMTKLALTGKFRVMERSQMSELLKEQGFQQSGCTNSECAVQLGQLLGVKKIVLGELDKLGNIYSFNTHDRCGNGGNNKGGRGGLP